MAKESLSESVLALLQSRNEASTRQIVFLLKAFKKRKGIMTSLTKLESAGKITCVLFDRTPFSGDNSVWRATSARDIDSDWQDLMQYEPVNVLFRSNDGQTYAEGWS